MRLPSARSGPRICADLSLSPERPAFESAVSRCRPCLRMMGYGLEARAGSALFNRTKLKTLGQPPERFRHSRILGG